MSRPAWLYQFGFEIGPRGAFRLIGRSYFDRVVASFKPGLQGVLTLTPKVERRTNAQNRLMWGTVYDQIVEGLVTAGFYEPHEWAEAKALIHEGLCAKYQGLVKDKVTGIEVRKFRSSKATKAEFTEFVAWATRFAATEFGVVVVLPGELE